MSEGRSGIYTVREKLLLNRLIKEHSIVESKKTDGATIAEKNRAWEELTITYNSQPEVNIQRTHQQLRKLWNNLKQRKRKETAALSHDMLATGGGGPAKVMKTGPRLQFLSEAAAGLDVTVDGSLDSTHSFEKVSDHFLADLGPSTSKGSDEPFFTGNATEESVEGVVPMEFTTPTINKEGSMLSEDKLRCDRLVEAIRQQQELHNLKKQIAEAELLRVQEITRLDLQKARFECQEAADKAELASLKLKQFKRQMLFEDH